VKTPHRLFALGLGLVTAAAPAGALAHTGGSGSRDVVLHVGDAHDSCYFDLHAELTASQFKQFAAEGGQVTRFRQTSSASTLGAGTVDVAMGYSLFFIDDTKGAWNNTMSHPDADHYLGQQLGIPYLALRVGIADSVDAEAYGTLNPQSNYGLVGVASKIRVLEQSDRMPVSVAVRPSASGLIGPSEVQAWNLSADVSVSRDFHGLAPFAGVAVSSTLAVNSSSDSDVANQIAVRPLAFAGLDYRWKAISVGAQAEIADVAAVGLRAGGRF
jgi:hypothetical protein